MLHTQYQKYIHKNMNPKITIIKRDSYSFPLTFKDSDCNAIDITGYTIFFTVKTLENIDSDDTTAIIQKSITSHISPTTGQSLLTLTATDTDQTAGTYWYDLQVKTPAGNIISCEKGEFGISQDVTKRTDVPSA